MTTKPLQQEEEGCPLPDSLVTPECLHCKDGSPSHFGNIQFVGKSRDQLAPYIQIADSTDVRIFRRLMFDYWQLPHPHVLMSITGGAQDFKMRSRLEQVFSRGLVRAAQHTSAWIITAGLDTGVMDYVGRAVRMQEAKVPTIAIAPFNMVSHNEALMVYNGNVSYKKFKENSTASAALEPNHTHFILVDDGLKKWGGEISFRSNLEDEITRVDQVPLVLIVVEGGPGTFKTVREGVEKGFPVVVIEGSGRAADMIAFAWKKVRNLTTNNASSVQQQIDKLGPLQKEELDVIITKSSEYNNITLFDLQDDNTHDLDVFILRAILGDRHRNWSFEKKLLLGVEWNRPDILADLFNRAEESRGSATQEILQALDSALQKALELNRPHILELLLSHGANPNRVKLKILYSMRETMHTFKQLLAVYYSEEENDISGDEEIQIGGMLTMTKAPPTTSVLDKISSTLAVVRMRASPSAGLFSHVGNEKFNPLARKLLLDWLPTTYVENEHLSVSFTDLMIWAILVNRKELAYSLWKRTSHPIHTALLGSLLYRKLASCVIEQKSLNETADWFESLALGVLDQFEGYSQAKPAIELAWPVMGNRNVMKIAAAGECRNFLSHAYCQRLLDEEWCSTKYGKMKSRVSNFQIIFMIFFPFLVVGTYKKSKKHLTAGLYHFYELPVCKLWTNTLFYVAFLLLLSTVAISSKDIASFSATEIFLFFWMSGLFVDEIMQYCQDPDGHFDGFWNKVDFGMYSLMTIFIILRFVGTTFENEFCRAMASEIIAVTLIVSYLRLMNVFSINYYLGPLLIAIGRMMKDIALFLVIFLLFFVAFSLGFMSLTRELIYQVSLKDLNGSQPALDLVGDEWMTAYPKGTLGLAFWSFLGEFGESFGILAESYIAMLLLGGYLILSNILLVNLLIAMMADTYSSIRDNSDKQWKFSRYFLVKEYHTSTLCPPPLNLLLLTWRTFNFCVARSPMSKGFTSDLVAYLVDPKEYQKKGRPGKMKLKSEDETFDQEEDEVDSLYLGYKRKTTANREILMKRMQIYRETFLEKEESEGQAVDKIIEDLKETVENLNNRRDEDREILETKMDTLLASLSIPKK